MFNFNLRTEMKFKFGVEKGWWIYLVGFGIKSLIEVRFDFDELVLICTKNVNEFVLICFGIRSSEFA